MPIDDKSEAPTLQETIDQLATFGGVYKQAAKALTILATKTADYNKAAVAGFAGVDAQRDVYFPFGRVSYVQMIHVKSQRLISLAQQDKAPNHESFQDTYLDMVNYALFGAEKEARTKSGLALNPLVPPGESK